MFLLENIKKTYNGKPALDIETLSLEGQGITALYGPNGSGKTTLLNILAFLDFDYEGRLWFKHSAIRPSMNLTTLRRDVAMLAEPPYFFKGTVFDNAAYGLNVRRVSGTEIFNRVKDILAKVGLTGFENKNVDALSAGEKQRLALVRVLVLDTEIVLLDEPALRMDKGYIEVFENIISDSGRNKMIVMTTHNLSQAYRLTDKIIYLIDGKVADIPPHNTFLADIIEKEGGIKVATLSPGINIDVITEKRGPGRISIDPTGIIVSMEPFNSSARNMLKGRIINVKMNGAIVELCVDAGLKVSAFITKRSFDEMGLNINKEVCLAFKASSVKVF